MLHTQKQKYVTKIGGKKEKGVLSSLNTFSAVWNHERYFPLEQFGHAMHLIILSEQYTFKS